MKSSIRLVHLVFFVALSACEPVVTPKPIEQSATPPDITQTYTPTETNTPTITNTSTKVNTPTETPIPVPEYVHGIPALYEQTIVVSAKDKQAVMADIMANPALSSEVWVPMPHRIQPQKRAGKNDVMILCDYGDNCIIRATIRENNPNGGLDMIDFFWEFREPDGTHVYMIGYEGAESENPDEDFPKSRIDQALQEFQGLSNGQPIDIYVTIRFNQPENKINPAAWGLTNDAPEENQKILQALWESAQSGKLPKDLSTITVHASPVID